MNIGYAWIYKGKDFIDERLLTEDEIFMVKELHSKRLI
jgi:hypothetical protein